MEKEKVILVFDVEMVCGKHLCNSCPLWNSTGYYCQYGFIEPNRKGCPLKPFDEYERVMDRIHRLEKEYFGESEEIEK